MRVFVAFKGDGAFGWVLLASHQLHGWCVLLWSMFDLTESFLERVYIVRLNSFNRTQGEPSQK